MADVSVQNIFVLKATGKKEELHPVFPFSLLPVSSYNVPSRLYTAIHALQKHQVWITSTVQILAQFSHSAASWRPFAKPGMYYIMSKGHVTSGYSVC